MIGTQTGIAAPVDHDCLPGCGMCPSFPTSQYGERRVHLLAHPVATSKETAQKSASSPLHQRPLAQEATAARNIQQLPCGLSLDHPQLPINSPEPGMIPIEKLVEAPPSTPILEEDSALTDRLHQPDSLSFIRERLKKRCQVEQQGEDFKFDLLMPTLRNMRTFIRHIRGGHQFTAALTDEEEKAMAWLAEKTQALLDAKAPYKRTVHLAIALMAVCDIITARQVIEPLRKADASHNEASGKTWQALSRDRVLQNIFPSSLHPARVTECCWGGNNPGGLDEVENLVRRYVGLWEAEEFFSWMIDDKKLLFFPSFQSLDLRDFCRFGQLPLHPIGMTTAYALNADGFMMSPMRFALHDIGHSHILRAIGACEGPPPSSAAGVLHCPRLRFEWRYLLLDQMPASLASLKLEPALCLLLFQIFHEAAPGKAAAGLDYSHPGFLYCLCWLALARRSLRNGYTQKYRSVTDAEAARAALWMLCLWRDWQAAGLRSLTPQQREACARHFEQNERPLLDRHLAFLARHRSTLRQLFADRYCRICNESGQHFGFRINCRAFKEMDDRILFSTRHNFSGLRNIDNTDLLYFQALGSPALRQEMQTATGEDLPDEAAYLSVLAEPVPDEESESTAV
ncbi:MAG: hypothetical protein OXC07_09665 [Kistimonas sp.]|nr:hypothetical protein [Kistimonas sp.]